MKRPALLFSLCFSLLLPTLQAEKPAESPAPQPVVTGTDGLVDPSRLAKLLPEAPADWVTDPPTAKFSINDEKTTVSFVHRAYMENVSDKAGLVSITIRDFAKRKEALVDLTTGWTKQEGTNGYQRVITVMGFPAYEDVNRVSQSHSLIVIVKGRFLVEIEMENATVEEFEPWKTRVDLKQLAAME